MTATDTSVAFDAANLTAAVNAIMETARKQDRAHLQVFGHWGSKQIALTDTTEIGDWLMDHVSDLYARSTGRVVAQAPEVVFAGVGVVFEIMPTKMCPPPIVRGEGRPAHLAFFWKPF